MLKRLIPLKYLILLLVSGVFLAIFAMSILLYQRDYDYIIEERGDHVLKLVNQNMQEKLSNLFINVQTATTFYGDYIEDNELYKENNISKLQEYSLSVSRQIQKDLPQISTIYYADEQKRFIGYKIGDDGSIISVLSDQSTAFNLNFYSGETTDTRITMTVSGYDPTQRSWYIPVADTPMRQWSKVFATYAKKENLCSACLKPVFDEGNFTGVACMEIRISELNKFLQSEVTGDDFMYVINDHNELIADSVDEPNTRSDPSNLSLPIVTDSSDRRIAESFKYIENNSVANDTTFTVLVDGNKYYGMYSSLDNPSELGFKIVNLISENNMIGVLKRNQYIRILFITIMFFVGIILNFILISKILNPIRNISEQALQAHRNHYDIYIDENGSIISEMHSLAVAFNEMLLQIHRSFDEITYSEKRFRLLFDNTDDIITSIAPNGEILMINEKATPYFNLSPSQLIGMNILSTNQADKNNELILSHWNIMINTHDRVNFSLDTHNYQGIRKIFSVQLIPLYDQSEELTSAISIFTDITDLILAREKIEDLLKSENEKLEELIKVKTEELNVTTKELMEKEKMASLGNLVAGISHEINTPLGVAISAVTYLQDENNKIIRLINEGGITKDHLANYIELSEESTRIIFNNLERATNLVNSFKKISVNQSAEAKIRFNFYDYIQSVLLMLKHEYKNAGHVFVIDCPKDLILDSYPGAYSQIFTNLIMNSLIHAFKEDEAGEISIRVSIIDGAKKSKQLLRIEYRDNGHGIAPEHLPHIFEPFFTTARGSGKFSGSGLGLNIVYNLVTASLQGDITCKSEPSKGVLFLIEVPYN